MSRRWRMFAAALTLALDATGPAAAFDVADYPDLSEFIDAMTVEHAFARDPLVQLFAQARVQPGVIRAIERPAEARPWHQYRKMFVTPDRVRLGRAFLDRHRTLLARAQRKYGVPPEIIVAILGVETRFGRELGAYRVLDALTTLALYHPPRAAFFQDQLKQFLLLTRELGLDPAHVRGSYAGALGIPQFIPSSYRDFAVDFNRDQQRDLFASPADAIGSVANFLKVHGWERNAPVADPADTGNTDLTLLPQLGTKPHLSVAEFIAYGIYPRGYAGASSNGGDASAPTAPDSSRAATLFTLEEESGPVAFLGYQNFYAITRYNRSLRYAMAVYELSRMISNRDKGAR